MTRATIISAGSLVSLVSLISVVVACSAPADAPQMQVPLTPQVTAPSGSASAPSLPVASPTDLPPLTSDAGVLPVAAGSCAPATTTTPPTALWKPPHALRRNVCTPQEATALAQCFITQQNCQAPINPACHACAISGEATPYSSALLFNAANQPSELNVEGCVAALSGDTSPTGCGPKLQARFACAGNACSACTDEAQRTTCLQQADTTTCSAVNQAAACATPYLPQCVQGNTELEVAFNLVRIFCGP